VGIAFIRSAAHLHSHRRGVVRKVSAGASNTGIIGARRMYAHFRCRVNNLLTRRPNFVLRLAEQIFERLLRGVERARAAFNKTCEIRRHQNVRHLQRAGLVCSLPEVFGARIGQVDDTCVTQSAGSLVWAEYDDFHWRAVI
jgi:hypothetical protein